MFLDLAVAASESAALGIQEVNISAAAISAMVVDDGTTSSGSEIFDADLMVQSLDYEDQEVAAPSTAGRPVSNRRGTDRFILLNRTKQS